MRKVCQNRVRNCREFGLFLLGVLAMLLTGTQAFAQAGPYRNTSATALNESVAPCAGTHLTRTINVADSFIIADVDFGLTISHTYRGDIQATLESPDGTIVSLVTNDGGNGLDNYDVLFDDAAGNNVNTAPHNTNDNVGTPYYDNDVRPLGLMSDFNAEDAQGNWIVDMCDFYNADVGMFRRAELFFTEAILTDADLSLAVSTSTTTPTEGTNVTLTFVVSNAGPNSTDGVTVDIPLPSGLSHVSDTGGGDFNSGTGIWTIPGSIASSGSTSLSITAFVELSGSYAVVSEVDTATEDDPDSTPGNAVTSEDDYDNVTLAPITPPFPSLLCPAAASVLDWDIVTWTDGDDTETYTVDGEAITLAVTADPGILQNNATYGGQSPAEQTTFNGGYSPVDTTIAVLADQVARADTVDIDLTLGTYGTGVAKVQLSLFDVDFGASQFEDRLTVTGSLGGSSVSPTLTGSANNTVTGGNVVTGDTATGGSSGAANVTIEFNSPVDSINIAYGNGPGAPAAPGLQGIGIHNVYFCPPTNAVLTASKTAEVFDPSALGLYAVPGNDIVYTIEFTNEGSGPADSNSVEVIDALPPEIRFYNGDIDDGGPETDPVIGIDSSSGLTFNYATDVRYSNAGTKPANFAACGYSPSAGYDANVTFICFNPKGAMAAGDPDPSFALKFRAGIK